MPQVSSVPTTFERGGSHPSSPFIVDNSRVHGGHPYSQYRHSVPDMPPPYDRQQPQLLFSQPHLNLAMNQHQQPHHPHPQQTSHMQPDPSFWAWNGFTNNHTYGEAQPSPTTSTNLPLFHAGGMFDSQHYQSLAHAHGHPSNGHPSSFDMHRLPTGNVFPRSTNLPSVHVFGGLSGAGVSGSLDPETGVFSRTVEHPRMRTAQACEKCRIRKAKCSGEQPNCKRCLSRGLICEYAPERKMRGPNKPKPSAPASLPSPTSGAKRSSPDSSDVGESPGGKDSGAKAATGSQPARKRAATLASMPTKGVVNGHGHLRSSSFAQPTPISPFSTNFSTSTFNVHDLSQVNGGDSATFGVAHSTVNPQSSLPPSHNAGLMASGRSRLLTPSEAQPNSLRGRPRPPPLDFSNARFNAFQAIAESNSNTFTSQHANQLSAVDHAPAPSDALHLPPQHDVWQHQNPAELYHHHGAYGAEFPAAVYDQRRMSQPSAIVPANQEPPPVGRARASSDVSQFHFPSQSVPQGWSAALMGNSVDQSYLQSHPVFSADSYTFPRAPDSAQHAPMASYAHVRSSSITDSIPSEPSPVTPHSVFEQFLPSSSSNSSDYGNSDMLVYPAMSYGSDQESGMVVDGGLDFDTGMRFQDLHMGSPYVDDDHKVDGDGMQNATDGQ